MNRLRSKPSRSAFTLVELLIAIAVIGILVGMLAWGVMPALNRAREFSIQQEMAQIGGAVESFKTKYGFYPPSWVRIMNNDFDGDGSLTDADRINNLLPYINRIARNHQEAVGAVGSRPIDFWWAAVGSNIEYDHGDDLVFWLSGLVNNKQFPLTGDGDATDIPAAFDDGNFEREVFYDFKTGQLEQEGVAAHYKQPAGKEASYLYIDHASYGFGPSLPGSLGGPLTYDGYTNAGSYENADTFQLVTYGMDGLAGSPGDWQAAGTDGEDNICNFAEGRLDRLMLGTAESTVK